MVYGVATKFGKDGEEVPLSGAFEETRVVIPAGARVLEISLGGGRIVVRLQKPDGGEALVLIDAESGKSAGPRSCRFPHRSAPALPRHQVFAT